MPTTRGAFGGSNPGRADYPRYSLSRLAGMASLSGKRESGSPPTAKPITSWFTPEPCDGLSVEPVSGSLPVKIRRGIVNSRIVTVVRGAGFLPCSRHRPRH
ncbi:hypothetical protein NKH69_32205 [Mesorhizobium sp. M0976]|uniref:hypothetical protein n=1 Tax=Mesorhizobium sp. M0976 TaxID=2957038 RepID=UPI00333A68F5